MRELAVGLVLCVAVAMASQAGEFPVVLTAADAGRVIDGGGRTVSCGCEVGGWTVDADGAWSAAIPDGAPPPGMLLVDGAPRPIAQWPLDGSRLEARDLSYAEWRSSQNGGLSLPPRPWELTRVQVNPADVPKGMDFKGAILNRFHIWDESAAEIAGYEPARGLFTLASGMEYPSGMRTWPKGYVLRNVREGMVPGRWMYDARSRRVRYRPSEKEAQDGFRAEIPLAMSAFRLVKGADRITIRNFRFRLGNTTGGTPGLRGVNPPGLIDATDVAGLVVEDCAFGDSAGQGVKLLRSPGYAVRRCTFENLGAGGVVAIHSYEGGVSNNVFRRVGMLAASSCAVLAGGDSTLLHVVQGYPREVGTTVVRDNRISDVPYCGIVVCGRGHRIAGNAIERPMSVLRDGAAIYASRAVDCAIEGNVARTDPISDVNRKAHAYYLDEFSHGTTVRGNVAEGFAYPVLLHRCLDCTYVSNRFENAGGDMRVASLFSSGSVLRDNFLSASGRLIVERFSEEAVAQNRIAVPGGVERRAGGKPSYAFVTGADGYLGIRSKDALTVDAARWRKVVVSIDDAAVAKAFAAEMSAALPEARRGLEIVCGSGKEHPDADCAVIGFVPKAEWLGRSPSFLRDGGRERERDAFCAAYVETNARRAFDETKGMRRVVLSPFPIDEYSPTPDGSPFADYGNTLWMGALVHAVNEFANRNGPIVDVDAHMVLSRRLAAGEKGLVAADRVTPLRKAIRAAARETVGALFREADTLRTYR